MELLITYTLTKLFKSIIDILKLDNISFLTHLTCFKCFTFWFILIITQSLLYASFLHICAMILDNYLFPIFEGLYIIITDLINNTQEKINNK